MSDVLSTLMFRPSQAVTIEPLARASSSTKAPPSYYEWLFYPSHELPRKLAKNPSYTPTVRCASAASSSDRRCLYSNASSLHRITHPQAAFPPLVSAQPSSSTPPSIISTNTVHIRCQPRTQHFLSCNHTAPTLSRPGH